MTLFAQLAEIEKVFEKSRPVEPTVQDFFSSFVWTEVSTAHKLVAKRQHTPMFIPRKTPYDLIRTVFEEIQFFSKEKPYLSENDVYPDLTNQKVFAR